MTSHRPASKPFLTLLTCLCCWVLCSLPAMTDPSLIGVWEGTLRAGETDLLLRFHLKDDPDAHGYSATLDSVTQGALGIPCSGVSVEQQRFAIYVDAVQGSFTGTLQPDGKRVEGIWTQGGQEFPLVLKFRDTPIPPPARPQRPIPPFPYSNTTVSVPHPTAGHQLGGTLTLPEAGCPCPAVILVSGSGAQDRDESLFGHQPFWVLADHLSRAGIAVLRYDDRGVGESTGDPNGTTRDFASDAYAVFSFLRQQPGIDPERVGIIGHSEGGLIAAMLAAEYPEEVAFMVGLAPHGIPGAMLMPLQAAGLATSAGASQDVADWSAEIWRGFGNLLATEPDDDKARTAIGDIVKQSYNKAPASVQRELGPVESQAKAIQQFVGPWFRQFMGLEPEAYYVAVRCPVLILHGSLDQQVPASVNQTAIRQALDIGGHWEYQFEILHGLNHLFQTAKTGSPSEYGQIEETFAPEALTIITTFIAGLH